MRRMGLDVGEKTVGVALSDELGITVAPLTTLRRDGTELRRLTELVSAWEVGEVVVGIPYAPDGGLGRQGERCRAFAALLQERLPIPVTVWDETLTTVEAEEWMARNRVPREQRRGLVDQVAATLILQSYLDAQSPAPRPDLREDEPSGSED